MFRSGRKFGGGFASPLGLLVIGIVVAGSVSCTLAKDPPKPNVGGTNAGEDAGGTSSGGSSAGGTTFAVGGSETAGDAGAGVVEQVCSPGEALCDGNRATVCNERGDGYESGGTKCSSKQSCLEGVCEEHECEPDSTFCSDNKVLKCKPNGLSTEEAEACTEAQYCDTKTASCKDGVCAPDEPVCDGNRATTCNPTGSGYEAGGVACETGKSCDAGICQPQICVPGNGECQGQNIRRCAENGLSWKVEATCTDMACVAANDNATCQGVCEPGKKRCQGNSTQACLEGGVFGAATPCMAALPECNGVGVCTERTNLLTQTEAFEAGVWSTNRLLAWGNSGSLANNGFAPDASNHADLIKEDATDGGHSIEQVVNLDPTQLYTFSVHLKAAGRTAAMVYLASPTAPAAGVTVRVNLSNGTAQAAYKSDNAQYVTNSVTDVGDGWYRASISGRPTATAGTQVRAIVYLLPAADGNSSYQGDGTKGVLVWGAQLEKGSNVTVYRGN